IDVDRCDHRACDPGVRRRRDGAGQHGPGWRSLPTGTPRAAHRHHRRGGYDWLGTGPPVRRSDGQLFSSKRRRNSAVVAADGPELARTRLAYVILLERASWHRGPVLDLVGIARYGASRGPG